MRFEIFVALRYLRGKRKNRFVSLITLIAVAGVSVGVTALIVVMSVMTGFDIALRATIIGNRSHLTVASPLGPIDDPDALIAQIEAANPEIQAAAPIIEIQALLQPWNRDDASFAYVIGVDPARETRVTLLAENLSHHNGRTYAAGRLPGEKEIVLGYLLADQLGAHLGDPITVFTSRVTNSPLGPRVSRPLLLTVSGIAQAQTYDFDALYAFIDLPTARMLTGRSGVDAVHCRLNDPFAAERVAARIGEQFAYRTVTWYESERAFFEALEQEKLVMFIILIFITLVAAFNITSILIMVVMEKRRDIGILRTLGVSAGAVLRLFVLEGLCIGLTGTLLGVAGGTLLALNLNPVAECIAALLHVDLFNSVIYYFDGIPVSVVPWDVFWITVCAVALTLLATIYPAWSAARLDPVDALRYE